MLLRVDRVEQEFNRNYRSPLSFLGPVAARDISLIIIAELGRGTNSNQNYYGTTRKQIEWILEVMSYSLSLPLTDVDTIKSTTEIYMNWITDYASGLMCKPELIQKDWDYFFPLILIQLRNLFIPRPGMYTHIHASLCSTVLISLRNLVLNVKLSKYINEQILLFLLSITSRVFSLPSSTSLQSLAEHLGEMSSSHFFYIWIAISVRCFPTPNLWQAFSEISSHCKHSQQFVLQWSNICLILTKSVLKAHNLIIDNRFSNSYGCPIMDDCLTGCNNEILTHLWLKILYALGDVSIISQPIQICRYNWPDIVPTEISISAFVQELPPQEHPVSEKFKSLYRNIMISLPNSFFNVMRFLSSMVQLFIFDLPPSKIDFVQWYNALRDNQTASIATKIRNLTTTTRNPSDIKVSTSIQNNHNSSLLSLNKKDYDTTQLVECPFTSTWRILIQKNHIETNTIINHFSDWLISSCISLNDDRYVKDIDTIFKHNIDIKSSVSLDPAIRFHLNDQFELGRAYAFSTMLRLLTFQPDNSKILDVYKSKFYLLLSLGLSYYQHRAGVLFSSIIISSTSLFSCNLSCIEILMPHYLRAVNTILIQNINYGLTVEIKEVRNAALKILTSIIPLASDIIDSGQRSIYCFTNISLTFECICSFIIETLCKGYPIESSTENKHLFITAMILLLHDTIHFITTTPELQIDYCINLMSKFSNDLANTCIDELNNFSGAKTIDFLHAISLIEFIGSISLIPNMFISESDVNAIIRFLCVFIDSLGSRPPIYHQKDLHSIIVAAYSCLITWVGNQNWIVFNHSCIQCLQGIIELGLTGLKSQNSPNPLKEYKEQKPISYRVYDGAEYLMLMLLEILSPYSQHETIPNSTVVETDYTDSTVSYFLIENTAVLSCIDACTQKQDPIAIVFIRGMTGKHIYKFQMISVLASDTNSVTTTNPRPTSSEDNTPTQIPLKISNFKTNYTGSLELCDADTSVIDVDTFITKYSSHIDCCRKQYDQQLVDNKEFIEMYHKSLETCENRLISKITPPEFTGVYHTYRMLLNNLSLLNFDVKQLNNIKFPNRFLRLNSTDILQTELHKIDDTPIRNTDFVPLFIVDSFNTSIDDIIFNNNSIHTQLFNSFLAQLGDEVSLYQHRSFLGPLNPQIHNSIPFIYYSNMLNELMVLPTYSLSQAKMFQTKNRSCDSSDLINETKTVYERKNRSNTWIDPGKCPPTARLPKDNTKIIEHGIILVWVEDESYKLAIPILPMMERLSEFIDLSDFRPFLVLMLYPLQNRMVRIRTFSYPEGKPFIMSPIYDGVVLKVDYLGKYIRESIFSCSLKRRLETDSYNSPHLKRKSLIQNLGKKCQSDLSNTDNFMCLFD